MIGEPRATGGLQAQPELVVALVGAAHAVAIRVGPRLSSSLSVECGRVALLEGREALAQCCLLCLRGRVAELGLVCVHEEAEAIPVDTLNLWKLQHARNHALSVLLGALSRDRGSAGSARGLHRVEAFALCPGVELRAPGVVMAFAFRFLALLVSSLADCRV